MVLRRAADAHATHQHGALMPLLRFQALASFVCGLILCTAILLAGEKPPTTGPATEKRFPPLKVAAGFKATLFACDPFIEYPSVIALGPRTGSLFMAADYMTGLGTDIVRRDEIRLLEDTDGNGYADKSTTVATGFNSIQGLAFDGANLYVMHAPHLSAVPFADGRAGKRRDLLTGLGLAPEKDQIRLHNANGVVVGHDGWLYLALGDHGCNVVRAEGDRLVLDGGGILRCRPDGRDLHVFATGLRNIYDVALDAELNVFVRDNENDGGTYKIRVCHSVFGSDHGYPYLYYERPDEALTPLADLGLGSSAGGVCYLEPQFPADYRNNLFFCEWGRAVVRYPLARAGASFAKPKEIDFAVGAADDPYGFKPTDLVIDRDGALFISDWCDGQRPKRGRGRIYRVFYPEYKPPRPAAVKESLRDEWSAKLNSKSYHERFEAQRRLARRGRIGVAALMGEFGKTQLNDRGRMHGVWLMARIEGRDALERLFAIAKTDKAVAVRVQAVRAIADLTDPVLVSHRLDVGPGDPAIAERLVALADRSEPRITLEVILALGRLRWPRSVAWLEQYLQAPDATLAHAAQWTMRRASTWADVLKLLDLPAEKPIRAIALRVLSWQADPVVVDGLIICLQTEKDSRRSVEYADALARVYKKPGPWTYWGFRPGPRPAATVAWQRTEAIAKALNDAVAGADGAERIEILRRMTREKVPLRTASVAAWIREEHQADRAATLLAALTDSPADQVRPHLEAVIRDRKHAMANRVQAVALFVAGLTPETADRLRLLSEAVEDGPVLAALLRAFGSRPKSPTALLFQKLASSDAEVRIATIAALAELRASDLASPIQNLLADADPRVRAAAARAAGKLLLQPAGARLLGLSRDKDAEVRRASLEALRRLGDRRAIPTAVAALNDPQTALKAIEYVTELGGPEQISAMASVARRPSSTEVLAAAGKALIRWASKSLGSSGRQRILDALAEAHGGGVLLAWQVLGPSEAAGLRGAEDFDPKKIDSAAGTPWKLVQSSGLENRVTLGPAQNASSAWLAICDIDMADSTPVEFFSSSSGTLTIWLNGKPVHERDKSAPMGPYPDRFEATLVKGRNRVGVRLEKVQGAAEFQLRFRRRGGTAEHERLAQAALNRAGNPEHGRQLFLNAEKSLCVKCHRIAEQGERVGPELTGLGSRFSKIHIVESILEPSRTIAPSFDTVVLMLKSGKTVTGVKVAEDVNTVTLVDSQAQKHVIARTDIEEQQKTPVSTMPDGLEKRLTEDEFVDLISFLVSLKARQ